MCPTVAVLNSGTHCIMPTMLLNVYGRVQGVYFRKYAKQRATELSVSGYARNGNTGDSVEIVAQGPQESLTTFLDLMRTGPRYARVREVTCEWQESAETFSGFEIRR